MVRIRWVTWWPAPYWIDRFDALARHPGVDLEVVFINGASRRHDWTFDESAWAFDAVFLDRTASDSGYERPTFRVGNVDRLLRRGRSTGLVMPYADLTCGLAAVAARVRRIPYHLFVANTIADARSGSRIYEFAKRVLISGARSCLATGPLQADYARRYAGRHTSIEVIGNPVKVAGAQWDQEKRSAEREAGRAERGWDGRFVIAFVGRLSPEKDLDILVAAVERLAAEDKAVTLAIAGSGPLEDELRSLASRSQARIDLLGFVEGDRLGRLYASADAFALPSRSESWGLVVNEAMEFSLPVVVSDRVGCRHLIESGESGFIVPAGDVAALAGVLSRLAGDPDLRRQVGEAGRRAIAGETIDAWVAKVLQALAPAPL